MANHQEQEKIKVREWDLHIGFKQPKVIYSLVVFRHGTQFFRGSYLRIYCNFCLCFVSFT